MLSARAAHDFPVIGKKRNKKYNKTKHVKTPNETKYHNKSARWLIS